MKILDNTESAIPALTENTDFGQVIGLCAELSNTKQNLPLKT